MIPRPLACKASTLLQSPVQGQGAAQESPLSLWSTCPCGRWIYGKLCTMDTSKCRPHLVGTVRWISLFQPVPRAKRQHQPPSSTPELWDTDLRHDSYLRCERFWIQLLDEPTFWAPTFFGWHMGLWHNQGPGTDGWVPLPGWVGRIDPQGWQCMPQG